jgi:7-cyano-7-deazaguanine reductase
MADDTVKTRKPGYVTTYTPSLLESIPRKNQREKIGITEDALPFKGLDTWNAYEFTWLGIKGKPEVAMAKFLIPANSANLIESKSLKHYLGSYANTPFSQRNEVISTLESDLSIAVNAPVGVSLMTPEQVHQDSLRLLVGTCLDNLDVEIVGYHWNPQHLEVESDTIVRESVYTHLFRTLCPLTGQPDIASVLIQYSGSSISHESLLTYLVSYREHAEFAEQVTERIFMDIMKQCSPEGLGVSTRFGRRGGIDINSQRVHKAALPSDIRVWRQ